MPKSELVNRIEKERDANSRKIDELVAENVAYHKAINLIESMEYREAEKERQLTTIAATQSPAISEPLTGWNKARAELLEGFIRGVATFDLSIKNGDNPTKMLVTFRRRARQLLNLPEEKPSNDFNPDMPFTRETD